MSEKRSFPVVFVAPYGQLGGSERYLELLLRSLDSEWVGAIVLLQHGPFEARMQELGYPVEIIPTSSRISSMLAASRSLRRLLRHARPRLVHANGIKAALVAGMATLGLRTRVVWVKHDLSWDGVVARAIALLCKRVIAPARAAAATFGPLTRGRVRVVHYGLPSLDIDRSEGRRRVLDLIQTPSSAKVVGLVGRLHPVKGHNHLLDIAEEVRAEVHDVRFVLVGGDDSSVPDYARRLRERIGRSELRHFVTVAGHREDAPVLVAGCDALVMPSGPDERGMGREVQPFAGLEAMAVGTPVVAYADGGVPELYGECAVLVPPGDRLALAGAVIRILDDPELGAGLANCGRRRVEEQFGVDAMVAATLDCYREAIG
jgi:glycosyltransferase involved in cell wall biosynthesis